MPHLVLLILPFTIISLSYFSIWIKSRQVAEISRRSTKCDKRLRYLITINFMYSIFKNIIMAEILLQDYIYPLIVVGTLRHMQKLEIRNSPAPFFLSVHVTSFALRPMSCMGMSDITTMYTEISSTMLL